MHVYIYDSFLAQKKYDRILANIETRITDLGLNGKICRLGIMKNVYDMIENELKRGAKTIIAVGNDHTINQIINPLANHNVPLGIIPVGQNNNLIATALGIEPEEAACDILSARRIIKLDLGKANNYYFLSNATINNQGTSIKINKDYSIEIMSQGETRVINLTAPDNDLPIPGTQDKFDPQDGILELFIKTKISKNILKKITGHSIFPLKKLTIINEKLPVVLDNSIQITTPVQIGVVKQKLNVIVGRKRNF